MRFLVFFIVWFVNVNHSNSQDAISVRAELAKKKIISDSLEIPANVFANESVQITTVIAEKIRKIYFKEGSFVKKNDLLVQLVNDKEQAIRKQILAELQEAELNFERAEKLSVKGNISQTILENRLMKKKKLQATLEEIDAELDDLKIKAPFDGFISIKNFSEGSLLKPGDIVTNIFDIKKVRIEARVPEIFINKFSNKTKFILSSELLDKKKITGKISIIDPIVNEQTRTFKIIGIIDNPNYTLKPGLMINLIFKFKEREALLVRENAILNQDDISFLYVVNNKNEVFKRKIIIGSRKNGLVEIQNGITKNDLIIFEGINKIKPGALVKVQ
ncbi:MAG: efflux RND transporter periplasmic adaptor subunit [Alphaproteobacteria bacterium]